MKQKIVAYNKDQDGHWRAELECGHYQHLRHDPPLRDRPWIFNKNEREKRLGAELECTKCDTSSRSER